MNLTILTGDWIDQLRTLPDQSVQCCVTSPPYWGLRDYGVPGQLGLEKTPEEYVAKLVSGFREVMRVLRDDGTLWVNLGDCYATGGGRVGDAPGGGKQGEAWRIRGLMTTPNRMPLPGLKSKDLVGIPWRVARALQEPYYTGSIKDVQDRIWLAAMIDAEGCMFIHKRKAGTDSGAKFTKADGTEMSYERTADTFGPGLEVANTSEAIVQRCMAIVGKGSICSQSPDQNNRRKQTIYRWNLRTIECRDVIREIYPHLVAKQHQARLVCGCSPSGKDADAAHQSLIALHNGGDATIDFPAPKTMFEPGWYLRSDIIWSKCNPMPESVTDRPTKSHEYIFLLSKNERYFYDVEAVKEPYTQSSIERYQYSAISKTGKTASVSYRISGPESVNGNGVGRSTAGLKSHEHELKENGRNKRTVWTVNTSAYPEAHFATFPPALIKPCILAGCPVGGTVLDPFFGSGTTGQVALELGRNCIGIELNPKYVELARQRCNITPGLQLA